MNVADELEHMPGGWDVKYRDLQSEPYLYSLKITKEEFTVMVQIPEKYPDEIPVLEFGENAMRVIPEPTQRKVIAHINELMTTMTGKPMLSTVLEEIWNMTRPKVLETKNAELEKQPQRSRKLKKKQKYQLAICFGGLAPNLPSPSRNAANISKNMSEQNNNKTASSRKRDRKLPSMKTARDVINRLKWDEQLKNEHFILGYEDRFRGLIEVPVWDLNWEDDIAATGPTDKLAIPEHRIQHFKWNSRLVWEKITRTDFVFGSTGSHTTIVEFIERHKSQSKLESQTGANAAGGIQEDKDSHGSSSHPIPDQIEKQSVSHQYQNKPSETLENPSADSVNSEFITTKDSLKQETIKMESLKIEENPTQEHGRSTTKDTTDITKSTSFWEYTAGSLHSQDCYNNNNNNHSEITIPVGTDCAATDSIVPKLPIVEENQDLSEKTTGRIETSPYESDNLAIIHSQDAVVDHCKKFSLKGGDADGTHEISNRIATTDPTDNLSENAIETSEQNEHCRAADEAVGEKAIIVDWASEWVDKNIFGGLSEDLNWGDANLDEARLPDGKTCGKDAPRKSHHQNFHPYNDSPKQKREARRSRQKYPRDSSNEWNGIRNETCDTGSQKISSGHRYCIAVDIGRNQISQLEMLQRKISHHGRKTKARFRKEPFLYINVADVTFQNLEEKDHFCRLLVKTCTDMKPFVSFVDPVKFQERRIVVPVVNDAFQIFSKQLLEHLSPPVTFNCYPHIQLLEVKGDIRDLDVPRFPSFNLKFPIHSLYLWDIDGPDNQPVEYIAIGDGIVPSYEYSYHAYEDFRQNSRYEIRKDSKWEVIVSKKLSGILRHNAMKFNIDKEGYLEVNEMLQHQFFRRSSVTESDIEKIVETNAKKRFTLVGCPGNYKIRATQGHSVQGVDLHLRKIEDPDEFPDVIHGTSFEFWKSISREGLKRMKRNHIHMTTGLPREENDVISGMRNSSNCFIYLDLKKAMDDGVEFFLSENRVILSEGIRGVIDSKYFKKVVHRKRGADHVIHLPNKNHAEPDLGSQRKSSDE